MRAALHLRVNTHPPRKHTPFAPQATRDAPTLWERHDAEMRKETAKRIALRQVAESVLEAGHGGWRGTTTAERMFDEEELAILSLPT